MEESSTELKPFVLKVNHFDPDIVKLVEGQSDMMLFVKSRGFMCAEPITARTGKYLHLATEKEMLDGEGAGEGVKGASGGEGSAGEGGEGAGKDGGSAGESGEGAGEGAGEGGKVEEVEYPVRILRYIPGEIMDKVNSSLLTPQLCYDVGNFAGRMDQALQVHNMAWTCYFK